MAAGQEEAIVLNARTGLIAAAVAIAAAAILGALAFEHIGGYAPCELCLEQRTPYYVGVVALAGALAARRPATCLLLCAFAALAFAGGAGLGIYQAGAEWRWWQGPADCASAALSGHVDAAALLERIRHTKLVSCTDPALRIFGLSLAGWNAVASSIVSALATAGCVASFRGMEDREWPRRIAARFAAFVSKD